MYVFLVVINHCILKSMCFFFQSQYFNLKKITHTTQADQKPAAAVSDTDTSEMCYPPENQSWTVPHPKMEKFLKIKTPPDL